MKETKDIKTRLLEEVCEYAECRGMLDCTDIILGYSGGADSSLLLYVLCEVCRTRNIRLWAAHVNHMFRGDEADSDERFCKNRCEALGVRFRSLRIDVGSVARERSQSDEECARDIRYGFFEEIKEEIKKTHPDARVFVATAHNATDNAETVIFNMTRGTALAGLCGIPSVREGNIIRPILFLSKERVLSLCSELSLEYVTDKTNEQTVYTRNRIRHNVLGELRQINPSLERAVFRMTEALTSDLEYLNDEAERVYRANLTEDGALDTEGIAGLAAAVFSRVLCLYFDASGAGYEHVHIKECMSLILRGGAFSLSVVGKRRAVSDGRYLCVEDDTKESTSAEAGFCIPLSLGENRLGDGACIFICKSAEELSQIKIQNVYKLFIQQALSFDTIGNTWCARSRRAGDRMISGGHTHTVKKLFSDKKLTKEKRAKLPIIECDGRIVWIPGVRAADGVSDGRERLYFAYAEE